MPSLRFILREIVGPTDRRFVSLFRRIVRRSIVFLLAMMTLSALGFRYVMTKGIPRNLADFVIPGGVMNNTVLYSSRGKRFVDPIVLIQATDHLITMHQTSYIPKGTQLRAVDLRFGGFLWQQSIQPSRVRCGVRMRDEIRTKLRTTDVVTRIVTFPYWAPVVLYFTWPVVAFIRGPFRRASRRAKGLCLRCGYNLEGNVSGTCPECGEAR